MAHVDTVRHLAPALLDTSCRCLHIYVVSGLVFGISGGGIIWMRTVFDGK